MSLEFGPITLTGLAPEILLAIAEYVGAFPIETTVAAKRRVTTPQMSPLLGINLLQTPFYCRIRALYAFRDV
jgi:hypothetical protein